VQFVRFFRSSDPAVIEFALNNLRDTTILGQPVWDGKKWTVWFITKSKNIKSGDLGK